MKRGRTGKQSKRARPGRANGRGRGAGFARPPRGLISGGGNISTILTELSIPLFAPRVTKFLRYADSFGMATTSGAITATQIFRMNDCYDPDYSSTGHQPMGFDQMMVFYNHFVVVRARLVCDFSNTASTTPTVCIRQDADNSALTVISRVLEIGACNTAVLEYKGTIGSSKQLSMNFDFSNIQGLPRRNLTSDPNLRGTTAASPAEITYAHVTMWDPSAATGSATCQFILEQEVIFFEPRNDTQSFKSSRIVSPQPQVVEIKEEKLPSGWEDIAHADTKECRRTPDPAPGVNEVERLINVLSLHKGKLLQEAPK